MALTPEAVIKKSFKVNHLRPGYDEMQVDDFLDQVVVELRRLIAESDELRVQLADCRASKDLDVDAHGDAIAAQPAVTLDEEQLAQVRRERDEVATELETLQVRAEQARAQAEEAESDARDRLEGELKELQERVDRARAEAREAELEAARAGAAAVPADEGQAADGTGGRGPAGIITLAQRLYDEHVQEGEDIRARLVQEAEQYRDQTVGDADQRSRSLIEAGQARHDELIDEAEGQRRRVLTELESQQSAINATISDLTAFEHEYRSRIRAFITQQLGVLERNAEGIAMSEETPVQVQDGPVAEGDQEQPEQR